VVDLVSLERYEGKEQDNATIFSSIETTAVPFVERQAYILQSNCWWPPTRALCWTSYFSNITIFSKVFIWKIRTRLYSINVHEIIT
jgi:hypothetical protein